jgi:hypothetical protein
MFPPFISPLVGSFGIVAHLNLPVQRRVVTVSGKSNCRDQGTFNIAARQTCQL